MIAWWWLLVSIPVGWVIVVVEFEHVLAAARRRGFDEGMRAARDRGQR